MRAGRTAARLAAKLALTLCVPVAGPALALAAASAETMTLGVGGWRVQSSAQAAQSGRAISQPGFSTASWLPVQPDDAGAVGTEINARLQDGACPNAFSSINMKDCFGYLSRIGPDTIPMFSVPWWFRTDFTPFSGAVSMRCS
jgi:exo-1,4-beta-D-glucosaminidase